MAWAISNVIGARPSRLWSVQLRVVMSMPSYGWRDFMTMGFLAMRTTRLLCTGMRRQREMGKLMHLHGSWLAHPLTKS